MQEAQIVYEWLVFFKDNSFLAQFNSDGTENLWKAVIEKHESGIYIKRAGWVPFSLERVNKINAVNRTNRYIAKLIPAHFIEIDNGILPFIRRRMSFSWYGAKGHNQEYFYILGAGGDEKIDTNGGKSFINGYYMAIDSQGHTRLDHKSNVFVPVLPPESPDVEEEKQNGQS